MADHPENQNRQKPSIEKNPTTLDNLPPEVRMNIMQQAMNVGPTRYAQAEAVHTVNALSQTTRNYRSTLVDNPSTLGADAGGASTAGGWWPRGRAKGR
ncbi:hypothetical protein QO002_002762 [Pararhizobium capsulatum DSM 1112]|uniref:Killing trait domain-containing protein n=1 Tax=Pararhizobium capsulatum DSM 1112 TaxID=1121113 RepID=A0ABU0BQV7_9HYPH|nr:hypothetical protein [Pararhizobium capsulatum]MDQ0320624.1 hypothetical protein [Pararhizobium capsulatum DSM 1112]